MSPTSYQAAPPRGRFPDYRPGLPESSVARSPGALQSPAVAPPIALTARILSQGDEITSGATLDTNANWLAQELWRRGVKVIGMASAADDLPALIELFTRAGSDADLIVSTGGL